MQGGFAFISSRPVASATMTSGGTENASTIYLSGYEAVSRGGGVSNTVVHVGGTQAIFSSGVATGATLSGGQHTVSLVRAGAFDDFIPRRDLFVSPLHAMFLDNMLIPADALANDVSIVQLDAVQEVAYFHLELDSHDVIMAEGAWGESFVDDDSRGMFDNAGEFAALYPHAARAASHSHARYCAPRVEDGWPLARIRRRLAARADRSASMKRSR